MNSGIRKCTFIWYIDNYSYCWHRIDSPEFTPDGLEGTSWHLLLYPRGNTESSKCKISVFLVRSKNDAGPTTFDLKYELSVIAKDGSIIKAVEKNSSFAKGLGYGDFDFLDVEEVLRRKTEYLPQDTLSLQCKMSKAEGEFQGVELFSARTRIGIQKISFLHAVQKFNVLQPNEKHTIRFPCLSKKGFVISSCLYFTDELNREGDVIVEISSSDGTYTPLKQNVSLLDRSGNIIECGRVDYRLDVTRRDILNLPLFITRQSILNRRFEYLLNCGLYLLCDCSFSTGIEFQKIEEHQHKIPLAVSNSRLHYNVVEKLSTGDSASEDMKAAYVNQFLTDVVLKTKTKIFHAHKIILCARSPVFKAMLTNDMKERNTDCIEIDDLENDIVEQLLLFLYSDNLENLHWESAIELYYVSDKYAIEKLKVICSYFLVGNVTTSTVSELLLLADTHNDSDLKNAAEDIILKHDERIFDAEDWRNLEKTHPKLVIKTLYFILKSKKEEINEAVSQYIF